MNRILEKIESVGENFFTGCPAFKQDIDEARRRFALDIRDVLITGETGVGKDKLARLLALSSPRADGPYITVDCPSIARELIEAELFGHERGAFTGAVSSRNGRFEAADGGILHMQEVGELTPHVQAKLLRVLQDREFERVGSNKPIRVDVRVIATTNRNLEEQAASGKFRPDLFYRLSQHCIHVPPLRDRPGDASLIARNFFAQWRLAGQEFVLSEDALALVDSLPLPGNIRQLRHVLEAALESAALHHDAKVTRDNFDQRLLDRLRALEPRDDQEELLAGAASRISCRFTRHEVRAAMLRVAVLLLGSVDDRAKLTQVLGIQNKELSETLKAVRIQDLGASAELHAIVEPIVGQASFKELDAALIRVTLNRCMRSSEAAAEALGTSRPHLRRLMSAYGIDVTLMRRSGTRS